MKKFLIFAVVISIIAVLLYNNHKLKRSCEQKTKMIDSLSSQIFYDNILLTEYEIMYDNMDSVCKEKMDSVMADIE